LDLNIGRVSASRMEAGRLFQRRELTSLMQENTHTEQHTPHTPYTHLRQHHTHTFNFHHPKTITTSFTFEPNQKYTQQSHNTHTHTLSHTHTHTHTHTE